MFRYIGLHKSVGRQEESGLPDGFPLNGSSNLQSLARFYGLKVPASDPSMSVAEYVARMFYGSPRVGDRTVWDRRLELVVQEIERGKVSKVSLRILPGWLPERRCLLPGDDAYNLLRRWTDHRPDHWGSAAG